MDNNEISIIANKIERVLDLMMKYDSDKPLCFYNYNFSLLDDVFIETPNINVDKLNTSKFMKQCLTSMYQTVPNKFKKYKGMYSRDNSQRIAFEESIY